MKGGLLCALLASVAIPALADMDADMETLIRGAASYGHAAESLVQGQPVIAVPIPGDGRCARVGVIYTSARGRRHGGPRIDNFSLCGEEVDALDEVSPAVPDDKAFGQVGGMTVRSALRYERQRTTWQGYGIEARRLSLPDSNGCAQVETIIVSERLLVAYNVGKVCP